MTLDFCNRCASVLVGLSSFVPLHWTHSPKKPQLKGHLHAEHLAHHLVGYLDHSDGWPRFGAIAAGDGLDQDGHHPAVDVRQQQARHLQRRHRRQVGHDLV